MFSVAQRCIHAQVARSRRLCEGRLHKNPLTRIRSREQLIISGPALRGCCAGLMEEPVKPNAPLTAIVAQFAAKHGQLAMPQ